MSENRIDEYVYNIRNELISATKNAEGAKVLEYQYQYDDIGNRITSLDLGTNCTYTANNLNQYTSISNFCGSLPSVALTEEGAAEFTPQFDDDGNQTLIKTATGIWQVTYNGENRPILWICQQSDNQTITNNQAISMSYDRMGRRVAKNNQRFVYNGYLCIGKIEDSTSIHYSLSPIHCFVWDPTEPVATRPLAWLVLRSLGGGGYYTHDGNKNVSEVVAENGNIVAHYEYAPFGEVAVQRGICLRVPLSGLCHGLFLNHGRRLCTKKYKEVVFKTQWMILWLIFRDSIVEMLKKDVNVVAERNIPNNRV